MAETMQEIPISGQPVDIFVIGGGVNGCGIARDAAGRGLSVTLAEMNDLASATSSASTKMFHGGLRYLEFFEVRLVRKALAEREVLLKMMPHISWPMRFVLPYHPDMRFEGDTPASRILNMFMPWMRGRRPAWLIRMGLFLYDHLGGRKILSGTKTLSLRRSKAGEALQPKFERAFEYSDCWVDDARLVVLNARDAKERGAKILTRTQVVKAERQDGYWTVTLRDEKGTKSTVAARTLVNAAGPWVSDVISGVLNAKSAENLRLVRGSHIVTRKLYDHDKCYFFQGEDGRVIFAIPYEQDFTLIGTTDADHAEADTRPVCTDAERDYLRDFASRYFRKPVTPDDVVWSYSGVRPLFDDGASSATGATRDYVLKLDETAGVPVLNVFGGKITTYRKLAENALQALSPYFAGLPEVWTTGTHLPGGAFPVDGVSALKAGLKADHPFLHDFTLARMVRSYGTEARSILAGAGSTVDLGLDFGAGLSAAEVRWLMKNEFAKTAEDVLWRRGKLGLRLSSEQAEHLNTWMQEEARPQPAL